MAATKQDNILKSLPPYKITDGSSLTLLYPQSSLLQVLQDLCSGAAEDGDARPLRGEPGGDGPDAGEGGRGDHDHHGQLRPAGGGHGDPGQRPGRSL